MPITDCRHNCPVSSNFERVPSNFEGRKFVSSKVDHASAGACRAPRAQARTYENTYIGRPVGGAPTVNDEADDVRWIEPATLDRYDIHPSMRRQIGDYLAGTYPHLG
ncbi:hypothetical protein ABIA38_006341 [Embleya sp. AB8]